MPLDRLDPDAALLVVDIQPLTLPNARAVPAQDLVGRIADVIAAFRASGRPVIFAVTTGMPGGRTEVSEGARSWPEEATQVVDDVAPRRGEPVLARTAWSVFESTDLDVRLRDGGSRQLVVVGLATTFGVESTVRTAYDRGFDVVVVSDAVSGPDAAAHQAALANTFPLLARVTDTKELVRLTS